MTLRRVWTALHLACWGLGLLSTSAWAVPPGLEGVYKVKVWPPADYSYNPFEKQSPLPNEIPLPTPMFNPCSGGMLSAPCLASRQGADFWPSAAPVQSPINPLIGKKNLTQTEGAAVAAAATPMAVIPGGVDLVVLGVADNTTGPAMDILLTTDPLAYGIEAEGPLDLATISDFKVYANSFTLVDGRIVDLDFLGYSESLGLMLSLNHVGASTANASFASLTLAAVGQSFLLGPNGISGNVDGLSGVGARAISASELAPIPEPSTPALMLAGLVGLASLVATRRRTSRA